MTLSSKKPDSCFRIAALKFALCVLIGHLMLDGMAQMSSDECHCELRGGGAFNCITSVGAGAS